jgi:hypothetical protein
MAGRAAHGLQIPGVCCSLVCRSGRAYITCAAGTRGDLVSKARASREGDMPIAETTYLYALAGLSVSFVGFSTLVIVFRQSAGGRLSSYDSYFVLSLMQAGFIVTAGALLPPLIALYGLSESVVLRVAGGITSIPIAWFVASVPGRRRAATGAPTRVHSLVPAVAAFCRSRPGAPGAGTTARAGSGPVRIGAHIDPRYFGAGLPLVPATSDPPGTPQRSLARDAIEPVLRGG